MRRLVALLLLALLTLAGCITPGEAPAAASLPATEPAAAWEELRGLMADVPCEAEVGAGTSANMLPLSSLSNEENGQMGEMDVRGDLAVVARAQALDVVDLSDPRAPVILGTIAFDASPADVKFLPGMEAAIVGAYEGKLLVVDVTDRANPELVGDADVRTQAHMVQPALLGDKLYVYVASQSGREPAFIYEMDGYEPKLAGAFSTTVDPLLGNHDIAIVNDTLLGDKPTLYLADGLQGWSVWSLDDPLSPQRIGGSIGQELGVGYVHTIRVGFFEGKRIVITMQEVGQNTLKVYDATNLQLPVLLARWNADPTRPTIPQHNTQLLGEWLFMAHYTEGVYVFNLSEVVRSPPLLGTALLKPAARYAIEDPENGGLLGFANVWDVSIRRGVIYTTELTGRFSAVGFGCLPIGDEAASATL